LKSQSMEQALDQEISLSRLSSNVSVLLATVQWGTVQEFTPPVSGYYICQRLSNDHSALRFDNLAIGEAFGHVRSVGLLPPSFSVRVFPVERAFRALNCVFEPSYFESATEIDPEQWHEDTDAFVKISNRRVETMMQMIYSELVQPAFGANMVMEAASTMILVEMARYRRQRLGKSSAEDARSQGGLAPWQLRRIHDRVAAALDMGYPSLSELAQLCGISEGHLMRTFKTSTGQQIHKYIAEERLRAAKRLLAEAQVSAKEISDRLGFCSPAYFSAAFRRMTGLTPTDFRRRARVDEVGGD